MGTKCKTLLILSIIQISGIAALSQTYVTPVRSDITPATPQSEAIMAAQAPQPDLLTGAASLSVPIYDVNVDNVSVPISLQYQSNGIKVLDDPAPLGYGWSLMPALRITRTILGRPDELYPFSGDPQISMDPTEMCYMCSVKDKAYSNNCTGRYDSEHDIVNIALPGKSLTRVILAYNDTISFAGAADDEYRVEADNKLQEIVVTDPTGTRYHYGSIYESSNTSDGIYLRTAWPLYKIVLDNGRTINLSWSMSRHPAAVRQWTGGYSFRDNWDLYQFGMSGIKQSDFDNDSYANAVLSRNSETTDFLRLDKITFPGGNVSLQYTEVANIGSMLTSIKVSSADNVIKTVNLTYADDNYTLLTGIDGGAGQTYSFDYNTAYGTNPFATWTGRHAQDRWGYYNAKDNQSLTPKIRVKTYLSTSSPEGNYRAEIGDADRSVDSVAMQALMLTRVTWPTGGTSAFEYEVHKFAPTKQDCGGEIEPTYDVSLSYGNCSADTLR